MIARQRVRRGYTLRDVPALLLTPLGRRRCCAAAVRGAWPVLGPLAALYRRTVLGRTRVVTVTGSLGKTTTARATTTALGGRPSRFIGLNSGGFLGFALLRARPGRHAVIEVGISARGQMASYARVLRPDVAVVTSIASDHCREVGTAEDIREEKAGLVRVLAASGTAVLNGDDPHVRWMTGQTRARVVTFGFDPGNDVRASEVRLDWPRGMVFRLETAGGSRLIRTRLLGRPMVYALLAAVAVALVEGVPLDDVVARLSTLEPTWGRLEVVPLPNGAILLRDDFKGSEETVAAALDVLAEVPARRRIAVLGEVSDIVGSQGDVYRRLGVRLAQSATDVLFVTGKPPTAYRAGAVKAGLPRAATRHCPSGAFGAIPMLRGTVGPGDVVLVKGRDTQRLARISLALMGRDVRCELFECNAKLVHCDTCPMLDRSWAGRRVV